MLRITRLWIRFLLPCLAVPPLHYVDGSSSPADIFNPNKTPTFTQLGFHYKGDAALDSLKGRVGAFGDFDSDLYTDLFWISEDSTTLQVIRWNPSEAGFDPTPLASVRIPAVQGKNAARAVVNVAPCDFNKDGMLDVMVVVQLPPDNDPPGATGGVGGHPNANVALFLFFGDTTTLHPRPLVLPPAIGGQPIIMEGNGDLWPDLFGEAEMEAQASKPLRRGGGGEHEDSEQESGRERERESKDRRSAVVGRDLGSAVRRVLWLNDLQELPHTCWNRAKDQDEEGVDCGGSSCLPCACFLEEEAAAGGGGGGGGGGAGAGRRAETGQEDREGGSAKAKQEEEEEAEDSDGKRRRAGLEEEEEEQDKRRSSKGGEGGCWFRTEAVMEGRGRLAAGRAHAFADMDSDGLGDLIVATAAGTLEVWLNRAIDRRVPLFIAPANDRLVLSLPPDAGSVTPADVDRDGRLDLVYAVTGSCARGRVEGGGGSGTTQTLPSYA